MRIFEREIVPTSARTEGGGMRQADAGGDDRWGMYESCACQRVTRKV